MLSKGTETMCDGLVYALISHHQDVTVQYFNIKKTLCLFLHLHKSERFSIHSFIARSYNRNEASMCFQFVLALRH